MYCNKPSLSFSLENFNHCRSKTYTDEWLSVTDHLRPDRNVPLGGDWGACAGAFPASFCHDSFTARHISGPPATRPTAVLRQGQT